MGEVVVKEGVKEPKKPRQKRIWWRVLLAWFGGFIFAFIAIAGTVAIVGTVLKTSQVVKMVGLDPNEFIGEAYRNDSILQMVMKLSKTKFNTLEDIYNVTPYVKKVLDETVNPMLESKLHFTFDWEELKSVPFKSSNPEDVTIATYMEEKLMTEIKIVNFIDNASELTTLYKYFFYDIQRDASNEPILDEHGNVMIDETHPFSLKDYREGPDFFNQILNYIKIGDVMNISEDSAQFIKTISTWKIGEVQSKFETLTVGELFTAEEIAANNLLAAISSWKISDFSDPTKIENLRIGDIIDTTAEGTSPLLQALANKTISELKTGDFLDDLYLSDIYGDEPTGVGFLDALINRNMKISDLSDPDVVMGITIIEIFPDLEAGNVLYAFKDYRLDELGELEVTTLQVSDLFDSEYIAGNALLNAALTNDPDLTIGGLLDYDTTISHLKLSDVMSDEDLSGAILQKLKDYEIGSLSEGINSLTLRDVIEVETGDTSIKAKIVEALGDYPIMEVGDHFNDLRLNDVLDIDLDSPMFLQSLQYVQLGDLSIAVSHLTLGQAIDIPEGSMLDKMEIRNAPISDADTLMNVLKANLTLGDMMEIPADAPKLLKTLQDVTIDNIYAVLVGDGDNPGITLADVMDIDENSPSILVALSDVVLFGDNANFEEKLENLKFNEVYEYDEDWPDLMKTLWGDPDTGGDFLVSELGDKISEMKLTDVLGDKIYEEDGVTISYKWWFLLKPEGEDSTVSRTYDNLIAGKNYTVEDFDALVTNFTYHMENESIFKLVEAEFFVIDEDKLPRLEQVVYVNGEYVRLGDLTITQFMNYCLAII